VLSGDSGLAEPTVLGVIDAIRLSMRLLLIVVAVAVSSWVATSSHRDST
jgi:hypothetical protein